MIVADLLMRSGKQLEADAMFERMDQGREQLLHDMPQMIWLPDFGKFQRSVLLVELGAQAVPRSSSPASKS